MKLKSTKIDQIHHCSAKDGGNIPESVGQLVFSVLNDIHDTEEEVKDDFKTTPTFKKPKVKKSPERRSLAEQDLPPKITYDA